MKCPICLKGKYSHFEEIQAVTYFQCLDCKSIFADPKFMNLVENSEENHYSDDYWKFEVSSAKDRSFGSSINRVAETFLYCKIPIKSFVDIGTGPGYLLDSLSLLMPNYKDIFTGVELNPPPLEYCSKHLNYTIGGLERLSKKVSAGICIEVIEHLTPNNLRGLASALSKTSEDGALFYFNSAQPSFVIQNDPNYLDPHVRGHIVSYSISGLSVIFSEYGLSVIPIPGRDWCFLVEKNILNNSDMTIDSLLNRIWHPNEENLKMLKDNGFGPLMYTIGVESSRCYLEAALVEERTKWALSLITPNAV